MKKELLVLFAKEPVCGQVKTRLGRDTGMKTASTLYDLMLRHIINNVVSDKDYDTIIYKTSECSKAYFDETAKGMIIKDQPEGNLGHKMQGVFKLGFAQNYEQICIIGTDCPDISHFDIQKTFELLKTCKLVLGPTEDGGYYLIGLSGFYPLLFEDIAWSTESVFSATLKIAESFGIKYKLLSVKTDIDEITDLERYIEKDPEAELSLAFKEVLRGAAA
ncbi:MAG: TIGR04282 family arsenosugar biosynthesis glycosyltransferase [Proteobacteria bacterium]|nr:TIGR04282 family arsenosugar biosynthesis glycosyltransferase [Pseudomonadota bacterium]